MQERWWMACCAEDARDDVERAVHLSEPEAKIVFAKDAESLRTSLVEGSSRDVAVAVGATTVGVSDINLAAAIAQDGVARRVVLVGRRVSGSLRSRATRAGIDAVIDMEPPARPRLREVPGTDEPARSKPAQETSASTCAEGKPSARAPRAGGKDESHRHVQSATSASASQDGSSAGATSRPTPGNRAPIVVVSSGRGGVGKSTTSALMALVAASWGMRVALVDADLCCGNLFTLFGLARPPALDAPVRGHTAEAKGAGEGTATAPDPEESLTRGASVAPGVTLWGPCARPEMAERVSGGLSPLIERLSHSHDLVVIDTPTTVTDASAQAFQHGDRLLLVHDESLGAIGSLARIAALAVRLGVARTQIVRVANWGDHRVRFDLTVGRGELGLETARAFRLLDGGAEVGQILEEGKASELIERDMEPVGSVSQMLAHILEDLGRLPENERAQEALEGDESGAKKFHLWRRKAV